MRDGEQPEGDPSATDGTFQVLIAVMAIVPYGPTRTIRAKPRVPRDSDGVRRGLRVHVRKARSCFALSKEN